MARVDGVHDMAGGSPSFLRRNGLSRLLLAQRHALEFAKDIPLGERACRGGDQGIQAARLARAGTEGNRTRCGTRAAQPAYRNGGNPSRTARTRWPSSRAVNGLPIRCTPGSSTPSWTTASRL